MEIKIFDEKDVWEGYNQYVLNINQKFTKHFRSLVSLYDNMVEFRSFRKCLESYFGLENSDLCNDLIG